MEFLINQGLKPLEFGGVRIFRVSEFLNFISLFLRQFIDTLLYKFL